MSINWIRVILGGLVAGAIINGIEYYAHAILLRDAWSAAFGALGKTPTGWSTFIPANFLVGIFAVWGYALFRRRYGPGFVTALRTGLALWIVFWVIPTMGLQPLDLFPNTMLASIIAIGLLDSMLGTLVGAALYKDASVTTP